jgi:hypothetical protein
LNFSQEILNFEKPTTPKKPKENQKPNPSSKIESLALVFFGIGNPVFQVESRWFIWGLSCFFTGGGRFSQNSPGMVYLCIRSYATSARLAGFNATYLRSYNEMMNRLVET